MAGGAVAEVGVPYVADWEGAGDPRRLYAWGSGGVGSVSDA